MALEWDEGSDRVVITAQAQAAEESEEDDLVPVAEGGGPDLLRVRLTGAAARAFARRALSVVKAGRPPCPFCALPLDPEGHVCPRANGYRR